NRAQSPTAAAEEAVVKGSRAHRLTPVSGSSAVPGVDEVPIEPDLPHARESDAEPEAASGPTISPEQIGEPRPAPGSWLSPCVLATHMYASARNLVSDPRVMGVLRAGPRVGLFLARGSRRTATTGQDD